MDELKREVEDAASQLEEVLSICFFPLGGGMSLYNWLEIVGKNVIFILLFLLFFLRTEYVMDSSISGGQKTSHWLTVGRCLQPMRLRCWPFGQKFPSKLYYCEISPVLPADSARDAIGTVATGRWAQHHKDGQIVYSSPWCNFKSPVAQEQPINTSKTYTIIVSVGVDSQSSR